mmetsp:Transcript_28858/g.81287  ORF Transcript_28858/g.81287 Transcript_28858/m.81287 type:complete len:154 (+) Transcript_28858:155-616(+)|eukprot:CAMPEP_0117682306 /NCGR_PEP_ID=MMETSP0804-20121206/19572_1 /TAXON_ID=1074897 /ORGANISM="Tetraselmis astigmatica, Strain CCMP880" /LENGTH=153 /DNA_ID=CAMNT_0005492375 /DNA_START=83 /DNA_END=544 /DNA_ORIENTATION=-
MPKPKHEVKLTQDERTACIGAFRNFDRDGSGTIDSKELKQVLNALGQNPSDEDIFNMIREVDEDESGEIELEEFLIVVSKAKETVSNSDDTDILAAFVAMGGSEDGSGEVSVDKLLSTVKEFELAIDLAHMLQEVDKDRSGRIDYSEFRLLLS